MYRKYKENKDNEYETIIKKQVNESRLVAEQEGITIPKTLDDYVAPSRAGALGLNTGKNGKKSTYNASHEDDVDLGIDVRFCVFYFKIRNDLFLTRMMMIKWLIWLMMMKDLMMKVIEKKIIKEFFFLFLSVCLCRFHEHHFFFHNYYFFVPL
jgi:hypothetical protein